MSILYLYIYVDYIFKSCMQRDFVCLRSPLTEVLVGGGAPPVDPNVVTKLPRAPPPGMSDVKASKAAWIRWCGVFPCVSNMGGVDSM